MTSKRQASAKASELEEEIAKQLRYSLGQQRSEASPYELFRALGLVLRKRLIDGFFETQLRFAQQDPKSVYYLSMEFLIGQSLRNNLYNLDLYSTCREAMAGFGFDFEFITEAEPDAALGNGGL